MLSPGKRRSRQYEVPLYFSELATSGLEKFILTIVL